MWLHGDIRSMSKEVKRGAFIVIEGLDRSGKSTQAAALYERLAAAGISVKLQKFPGALFAARYVYWHI